MELTEFEQVLDRFAEDLNNSAKRVLGSRKIGRNGAYGVTSKRSLQKSLTYSISDGAVSFGSPLDYAPFIHWGVNGTRKKRGSPTPTATRPPGVSTSTLSRSGWELNPSGYATKRPGNSLRR